MQDSVVETSFETRVNRLDRLGSYSSNRACRCTALQALSVLHMKPSFFFNYFKHVPEDLVISSTPGVVISVLGTLLMASLFFMQLMSYMELRTKTELVVDDLLDEMLRVNFNVTLPSAPCDYLSVDVSDLAGGARHNITKDILKWRLNSHGELLGSSLAVSVVDTPGAGKERHSNHAEDEAAFDVELDDDYEPPDANLSQPLTEATFNEFLGAHELTVVNFFAPWCIWCRRLEPVYLDAASKVPSLHFHGHTRLAQVDCVANQNFCAKNLVRAYPTLRMYKDVRRLLPPRCADAAACPHSRAPAPSPALAPPAHARARARARPGAQPRTRSCIDLNRRWHRRATARTSRPLPARGRPRRCSSLCRHK